MQIVERLLAMLDERDDFSAEQRLQTYSAARWIWLATGRVDDALALDELLEQHAERLGMPRYLAGIAQRRATLEIVRGRFAEAETYANEALNHRPDVEFFEGYVAQLALIRFHQGRLSELLESLSLDRARRAIRSLLEVAPEEAEIVGEDGSTRREPASRIKAGDRVLVRSGDTIPIDGSIISGRSSVDQKAITGESVPVPRQPGDAVFAGTINGEGALEIAASGPVGDTLIARMISRVRESQSGRAPIERRISAFARYYTPAVVIGSLLVMIVPG